jgi:hypothetical protein
MRVAEVAGLEGVGGEVSGLIRLWKSVEKSKAHCWAECLAAFSKLFQFG